MIGLYFFMQESGFTADLQTSIKIFVTSNLQGWFDSKDLFSHRRTTGLYYLYEDLAEAKAQNSHSLLLDSGDFFYGSVRSFYDLKKEENIFLYYFFQLPYDVITLGNRDLEEPMALEKILRKNTAISSNLENSFTKPYKIFYLNQKKIFITSLSYLEKSFQRVGWKKIHWEQALSKIKKVIKNEKPDLVIGVFHLSLFYNRSSYLPSVEQVLLQFPIWDFVIAGQSFQALPYRNQPVQRIAGIPVARAKGQGGSWLEIEVTFQQDKKSFDFQQHYPKQKKQNNFSNDFLQYLNEPTGWIYKKNKGNRKTCLQNTLHLALGENWTLHPRLELKPFFLKIGESLQRKHLFYWLEYFNKKQVALFASYDFPKLQQKKFQKEYFFESSYPIPTTSHFFQKYKKQYPVALSSYELKANSLVVKSLLQKKESIMHSEGYIHDLWFDYFQNNFTNTKCPMFSKVQ